MDLASQIKVEYSARVIEERYRRTVDMTGIGYVEVDSKGCILEANHAYVRMTGRATINDILHCCALDWTAPEALSDNAAGIERAAREGVLSDFETVYQCPDGSRRYLSINAIQEQRPEGARLVALCRDITENKESARRLQEAEQRFRTLFDASPDAYLVLDGESQKITACNSAAEQLLGASHGQLLWHTPADYSPEYQPDGQSSRTRLSELLEEACRSGRLRYEWMQHCPERGDFWVDVSIAAMQLEGRADLFVALRDITQRKALEVELERLVQELNQTLASSRMANEQLQKANADLEQFAFVASHDLQEPLRKVQSYGEMLVSVECDKRAVDYIMRMQLAAARMRALIDNLLAFSRIGYQTTPRPLTDLMVLVNKVLEKNKEMLTVLGADVIVDPLPRIEGNPEQLAQLFEYLLDNACKYRSASRPLKIVMECTLNDSHCRIIFRDNGIGFEQQYAERIFGIFQRLHTRREYEGTGIGLSICRRIVERHHGSMLAEGVLGQGARFVIEMPLKQPSSV